MLEGPLRKWNSEVFDVLRNKVLVKKIELENLQRLLLDAPSSNNIAREREVARELSALIKAEEQFLQQKSRVQFVKDRDQNSAFFFRHVAMRKKVNTVRMLLNDQGEKLNTYDAIAGELVGVFSNSLGVPDANVKEVSDDLLKDILGMELTGEMKDSLVAPVTHMEIKDVVLAMNGKKASRPDGYYARFFQASWRVVGADFLAAIQS
ncbi:hypothetical protein V6N13_001062 [Hibiscus sabdariffa]